jgi:formate dehydrogenase major subunit/formate dehydrogenase alpha subunit
MGGLPNVLAGYSPVVDEAARSRFAAAWGLDSHSTDGHTPAKQRRSEQAPRRMPDKVGLTVTEMLPGIEDGKIRALYILAEDPVMSDPDTRHIRACLEAVDFLLLQEIFPSETSAYADVLLPGASFAEKSGTFTNTERRVQLVRKAVNPPGQARPDWQIISELAVRIGARLGGHVDTSAPYASWTYAETADILREINALVPSYGGITVQRLERGERLQWPCPDSTHPGTPILHTERFTRGLGQFMPIDHVPPAEEPCTDFPMLLSTGRVLYHWHGGEMTRRASGLMKVYGESLVELSPADAERLGVSGGSTIRITSRRGSIQAQAWITERVPPGMVFANFHFPEAAANELTGSALDPVAKIPEYKVSAVKVEVVA